MMRVLTWFGWTVLVLNLLVVPINILMGDYKGAATSAGLAMVLYMLISD